MSMLSITETWLTGNDHFTLADLMNTLQDYSIYNFPRTTCRGGGVAVVARKGLAVKQNQTTGFSSFEHLDLVVTSRNKSFRLLTIYRPPPSTKNKLTPDKFFSEFSILLEDLIAPPHHLLLSGDFNFHVDDAANLNAMKFLDLITSADLRQHVNGATHRLGHTLDLLITRSDDKLISKVRTLPELLSDHNVVVCDINLPRPPASRLTVSYRKTRDIDLQAFLSDINKFLPDIPSNNDTGVDEQIDRYENTLRSLLDKHAPQITRTITLGPHTPWFTVDLRELRREKRRCERKYLSTRLTVDKYIYHEICRKYNRSLKATKASYYKKKVEESNQKQLCKFVDKLFNIKCAPTLPKYDSLETLAERFAEFTNPKLST